MCDRCKRGRLLPRPSHRRNRRLHHKQTSWLCNDLVRQNNSACILWQIHINIFSVDLYRVMNWKRPYLVWVLFWTFRQFFLQGERICGSWDGVIFKLLKMLHSGARNVLWKRLWLARELIPFTNGSKNNWELLQLLLGLIADALWIFLSLSQLASTIRNSGTDFLEIAQQFKAQNWTQHRHTIATWKLLTKAGLVPCSTGPFITAVSTVILSIAVPAHGDAMSWCTAEAVSFTGLVVTHLFALVPLVFTIVVSIA